MPDILDFFKGRKLIIGTQHGKESVIAPCITLPLGVVPFAPADFNTDVWGTFSGEVDRNHDPVTTARQKCLAALQRYQCDLGIASEGSFGPHPGLFFLNADEEILIFIDQKNNLEIIHREISSETNFNGAVISTQAELIAFANQSLFPSHALILRNKPDSRERIIKGIQDWDTLQNHFDQMIKVYGSVYAETDMRAMYNPTRMRVIEQATQKLIEKLAVACPACGTPGFVVSSTTPGLPCSLCHAPTRSVLSHTYTCQKCPHTLEKKYPHNKTAEDPMYCDRCNP